MSDKALRIIKVLIMNKNTPITVKMLAVMLDMSERSVNTYLKEVSEYCSKNQIPFVSKRGLGVYLAAADCENRLLADLLSQGIPHYSGVERMHYVIQVLLDGWSNYTVSMLVDELYTSRQTITADLDAAEQWLERYGLRLTKKSKTGLSLEGEEWNRRQAITALNREKKLVCKSGNHNCDCRLGKERYSKLSSIYGKKTTEQVCRALEIFEQRLNNTLVDYCYVMLVEYLCVQRQRMDKGFLVKGSEVQASSDSLDPMPALRLLIESLEFVFRTVYPKMEREYVYILLSGAEFQKDMQILWGPAQYTSKERVEEICHKIIGHLSDVTDLEFAKEQRLLTGVESFLSKCTIRTHYGIAIENLFLEEVKRNYGAIFNTCFGLGSYVREIIGTLPSEHEIAYLTLLVGGALIRMEKRVNAVFVGTGNLLIAEMTARKLEKLISGLRVIAVLSADQKKEISALGSDLMITTIRDYESEYPTVYVTPVIDERDILKLQKACNDVFTGKLGGPEPVSLHDYIKPEFILLDVEAASKDKLIELGCRLLQEHGCVTDEYYQEILHRETISSTEIGNGVAIPHGIENTVLVPSICMMRLNKKIDWGSAPVDIIFMLALNFNDIGTTRRFFKLFYEKAGHPATVEALRKARNSSEVITILQS